MILVLLGSQKFQFNRFLEKIDNLVEDGIITDSVLAQTGYSDYAPKHFETVPFFSRTEFSEKIERASLILTHAGTGSIVTALKHGKKVIAAARLAKYGEHVDNHQLEIIRQFSMMNYIIGLEDVSDLLDAICKVSTFHFEPYVSNTSNLTEIIDRFISIGNV